MQKSLSFSKGITTSPSDLLSDDSELVESVGTIFRSGELHPIQSPVNVGSVVGTIVHVHRGNGFTNIITIDRHSLYAYSSNDFSPVYIGSYTSYVFTGVFRSASSVNNTLLIATSEGIFYFLFKNGVYKALGSELPSFVFRPYFSPIDVRPSGRTACKLSEILYRQKWFLVYNDDGTLEFPTKSEEVPGEYNAFFVKDQDDKRSAFQTAVQGSMAEAIAAVKKINAFAFPFFLRVALRLFDGSYARISNPIACFPTINRNCRFFPVKRTDDSWVETSDNVYDWMCDIVYSYLNFQAYLTNVDGWEDIVKEVVVFASEEVLPFNIDDDWSIHHADETQNTAYANYMEDTFNWHFSDFSPQTQAHDIILPTYKSDTAPSSSSYSLLNSRRLCSTERSIMRLSLELLSLLSRSRNNCKSTTTTDGLAAFLPRCSPTTSVSILLALTVTLSVDFPSSPTGLLAILNTPSIRIL